MPNPIKGKIDGVHTSEAVDYLNREVNLLLVEAAGVEPDNPLESTQLIDSGNAPIGMMSMIAKSAVRRLYGLFPEILELPNSTFGRPRFAKGAF
jgi:hypothetical protein